LAGKEGGWIPQRLPIRRTMGSTMLARTLEKGGSSKKIIYWRSKIKYGKGRVTTRYLLY